MCRWLAYCGPSIHLDTLLFKPVNSLIEQSLRARESVSPTNGDGFGIGWYADRPEPGRYRDLLPAWNDENLRSICQQIRSPLFFAHVRASTGTASSRANCHPFHHGDWLFMHNGHIGDFERIRRDLAMLIDPSLYPCLQGTTDSEAFFYLMLTNGLEDDPATALARSVGQVLDVMTAAGVTNPFRMTSATSNGTSTLALRYSSDGKSPSLYYGLGVAPRDAGDGTADGANGSVLILSEPLDKEAHNWIEIPEAHLLVAADGGVAVRPFQPRAC